METDTIRVVTTTVLRRMVCCFDDADEIRVDLDRKGVCVAYTSRRTARAVGDVTQMMCRADFQSGQMWVDDLRVATHLRSKGIGQQLVAAAESLATHLGLQALNAFPLVSSRRFWTKMGYTSHPNKARVVKKELAENCPTMLQSPDSNDSGSACR